MVWCTCSVVQCSELVTIRRQSMREGCWHTHCRRECLRHRRSDYDQDLQSDLIRVCRCGSHLSLGTRKNGEFSAPSVFHGASRSFPLLCLTNTCNCSRLENMVGPCLGERSFNVCFFERVIQCDSPIAYLALFLTHTQYSWLCMCAGIRTRKETTASGFLSDQPE